MQLSYTQDISLLQVDRGMGGAVHVLPVSVPSRLQGLEPGEAGQAEDIQGRRGEVMGRLVGVAHFFPMLNLETLVLQSGEGEVWGGVGVRVIGGD